MNVTRSAAGWVKLRAVQTGERSAAILTDLTDEHEQVTARLVGSKEVTWVGQTAGRGLPRRRGLSLISRVTRR